MYPLQVARNESGQIVAMLVTFMDLEVLEAEEDEDEELVEDD